MKLVGLEYQIKTDFLRRILFKIRFFMNYKNKKSSAYMKTEDF